jgi:hypothetical protein
MEAGTEVGNRRESREKTKVIRKGNALPFSAVPHVPHGMERQVAC